MSKPTTVEELDSFVDGAIIASLAICAADLLTRDRRRFRGRVNNAVGSNGMCGVSEEANKAMADAYNAESERINAEKNFVTALAKSYTPVFRALPDDEFNKLTSLIDSLKLERALKRRADLEAKPRYTASCSDPECNCRTWIEEDELSRLRDGIDSMIRRGVKVL